MIHVSGSSDHVQMLFPACVNGQQSKMVHVCPQSPKQPLNNNAEFKNKQTTKTLQTSTRSFKFI